MSTSSSSRIMIDPYISYVNENGQEHHLKTRFFRTDNQNNTNQAATSNYYFGEYQFQQRFENKFTITVERCHPIQMLFQNCMETTLLRM